MTSDPLVSIVIDNYNYARFLPFAIDSALGQSYHNTEVIVVDDGSTDDSRGVIASYADRIIPVFKENGGQGSAFNAGFEASRGEIVVFLDADDMLEPSALARAVPFFEETSVVKVHWPLLVTDENGHRTGRVYPGEKLAEGDLREFVRRVGPTNLLSAPGCGNAWSRRLLEELFPMPEALYKNGGDTYLFESAPFFGTIRAISEPQTLYRQHASGDHVAHTAEAKVDREIRFYEHYSATLAAYCRQQGFDVDVNEWKRHSWWHRQDAAFREIAALPCREVPVIVADAGTWEAGPIHSRVRIPFPRANGEYSGIPASDEEAIDALERAHKTTGSAFFIVGWPVFWWLEHFADFRRYLDARYRIVSSNDRLIIYDLREATTE